MSSNPAAPTTDEEEALTRFASIRSLGREHRDRVVRVVSNILSTEVARTTYAQIIDGAPLADVLRDDYGGLPLYGHKHPVWKHKTLCPGVLEKTETLYANFDLSNMEFSTTLLYEFESSSPGSRSFNTLLVEISAYAVHQLAVMLWRSEERFHGENDEITTWQPPAEHELFWELCPKGIKYPLFSHKWYSKDHNYPHDTADRVGFWAENRIFGGVILFNRRASHAEDSRHAIYIHPDRCDATYRICKLLDTQKHGLVQFLSSLDTSQEADLLSVLPTDENKERVDPEEPIVETGIYRDLWERVDRQPEWGDARLRDVFSGIDYPRGTTPSASIHSATVRRNLEERRLHSIEHEDSGEDVDMS